jgi:hypothetical protein
LPGIAPREGPDQTLATDSPTLAAALVTHYQQRSDGNPDGQLLRYRNGRPVGRRRYDHLFQRLGTYLPWVATQQISIHWIRHTTLTWVEHNISAAVAHAYAGHSDGNDSGTTAVYVKATRQEVAQALEALTGEPHPLAAVDSMAAVFPAQPLTGSSSGLAPRDTTRTADTTDQ